MNIAGVRPREEFYQYHVMQQQEQRSQQIMQAKQQERINALPETVIDPSIQTEQQDSSQTFTSYEYASLYEPAGTYEMKGKDSSLEDLDVKKAITDMQRDEVLKQYQFFVSGDREVEKKLLSVHPVEDFTIE